MKNIKKYALTICALFALGCSNSAKPIRVSFSDYRSWDDVGLLLIDFNSLHNDCGYQTCSFDSKNYSKLDPNGINHISPEFIGEELGNANAKSLGYLGIEKEDHGNRISYESPCVVYEIEGVSKDFMIAVKIDGHSAYYVMVNCEYQIEGTTVEEIVQSKTILETLLLTRTFSFDNEDIYDYGCVNNSAGWNILNEALEGKRFEKKRFRDGYNADSSGKFHFDEHLTVKLYSDVLGTRKASAKDAYFNVYADGDIEFYYLHEMFVTNVGDKVAKETIKKLKAVADCKEYENFEVAFFGKDGGNW